jgi:hypothetical protein
LEGIEEIYYIENLAILLSSNSSSTDLFRSNSTGVGLDWLLNPRVDFVKGLKRITILWHDRHEVGKIAFLDARTAQVLETWSLSLDKNLCWSTTAGVEGLTKSFWNIGSWK